MIYRPLLALTLALSLISADTRFAKAEEPAAAVEEQQKKPLGRKETLFDGKTLGRWKVIEKHVFEHHGKVEVAENEIRLCAGEPATGVVYSGEFPTVNYEIRLEAQRTAGDDFFCGLTFPIDKSHATLIVGGWGGGVTGISNLDDYAAVENETTGYVEIKNNQWYEIRLRVTAEKVEAWVGAEQIVDLQRSDIAGQPHKFSVWWEQEPARPLGIVTWRTAAAIRNIEFERVGK